MFTQNGVRPPLRQLIHKVAVVHHPIRTCCATNAARRDDACKALMTAVCDASPWLGAGQEVASALGLTTVSTVIVPGSVIRQAANCPPPSSRRYLARLCRLLAAWGWGG